MSKAEDYFDRRLTKERIEILARAINGPWNIGPHPVEREKLESLRAIRWNHASAQDRNAARVAAKAVLWEMHERDWTP